MTNGSMGSRGVQSFQTAVLCAVVATSALACGADVNSDAAAAPLSTCVVVNAGDGFVTLPLPAATALDTLRLTATPSGPDVDAVIGLTAGPATGFASLATAVRFAPNGVLDARDGGGYRADVQESYDGSAVTLRVIADLATHTYSVFAGDALFARELARGYRFRTEQGGVTRLDHLAIVVDGSAGSVTVCDASAAPSRGVRYSHEGSYVVAPLAGTAALISDGLTTLKLDAAGRTVAQLARGGELAADAAGNVIIAQEASEGVFVDKYSASFAPIWQDAVPVPDGSVVKSVVVDQAGAVHIGLVSRRLGVATALHLGATGSLVAQQTVSGDAIVLDGGQPIVAWNDAGTLRITRYSAAGATVWTRAFTGRAELTAMATSPDHAVIFGGELQTPIDFGGGTLPTRSSENGPFNGFVVKLDASGAHVFSRRTGYHDVGGIAANATRIAVSSTEMTQFRYHHLEVLDPAGNRIATSFDLGFGENGNARRVAIDRANHVWWSVETIWPRFSAWPYLVALTL